MLTWGKEARAYLSFVGGVAETRAGTLLILPQASKSSFLGPGKAEAQNPGTLKSLPLRPLLFSAADVRSRLTIV